MNFRSAPLIALLMALGVLLCGALMFAYCGGTPLTCLVDGSILLTGNIVAAVTSLFLLYRGGVLSEAPKSSRPIRSQYHRFNVPSSRDLRRRICLFLL